MRKHNILYKYQYGFREHHSTSHATFIMDVMEYIYKSLDENKFVFGVYIDLKKHLIQLIIIFFYQNYSIMEYEEMP